MENIGALLVTGMVADIIAPWILYLKFVGIFKMRDFLTFLKCIKYILSFYWSEVYYAKAWFHSYTIHEYAIKFIVV